MATIHILDDITADKIAAGEVIERPVSVVKELLENAIDAGASEIIAELLDGGLRQILIIDNGCGMSKEDLPLAFHRHATSKIKDFNDLFSLHSFGFRGEALASIGTIAQCECTTGQSLDVPAWSLKWSSEGAETLEETTPFQGTRMLVKNLFFNVPARRKFMKSVTHEYHLIYDLIARYALAYPEITFKIYHQKTLTFTTIGRNSVEERLVYIYGEELRNHLLHLNRLEVAPNTFVEGWMTTAQVSRNNRGQESFFVNGRLVENRDLLKLIDEGYATYLPKGRFPICLLKLNLPENSIDVNVHPAKTVVQMNQFSRWRDQILDAIQDLLWQSDIAVPFIEKMTPTSIEHPAEDAERKEDKDNASSIMRKDPLFTKLSSLNKQTLPFTISDSADRNLDLSHDLIEKEAIESHIFEEAAGYEAPLKSPQQNLPDWKIPIQLNEMSNLSLIGQLNNTFILAQDQQALYLIDQHTCHERILYERYMKAESAKTIHVQRFLIPLEVRLSPAEEGALQEYILPLRDLGIIIESTDDERSYYLHGLPAVLHEIRDYNSFLKDLLSELKDKPDLDLADIREEVVTTASCKHAVKAHWPLTEEEMYKMINDLKSLDNPHTCPHGRPIIVKITMNDLYLRFQRGSYK